MEELLKLIKDHREFLPPAYLGGPDDLVVLLDPGHGGMYNGKYATAPNKMYVHKEDPQFTFFEGVFNRALMYTFAAQLRSQDCKYQILVPEDADIPLSERVRRAIRIQNNLRYDKTKQYKCYYHSIHGNAGPESATGIEIFTSRGDTKADIIATLYFQTLSEIGWKMRANFGDGDPDKEENFYVLKETPMPAILTENGFYSNRIQAEEMANSLTIWKLARCFTKAHITLRDLKIL